LKNVAIVELDMDEISSLNDHVSSADVFYHIAWEGGRNDFNTQMKNIKRSYNAFKVAEKLGAEQFICTGSQAEYGICNDIITEETPTNPVTAYGACKLATYNLLKTLSGQTAIVLTWVRIFSVYGENDNPNTLISSLFRTAELKKQITLTNCRHNWDFLYAKDAAKALFLIGEKKRGGLYNLAYGNHRPLKDFVEDIKKIIGTDLQVSYNHKIYSNINLKVSVKKIHRSIGWTPKTNFKEGILKMNENKYLKASTH
jgi:nucleoside-diphosphate-sugar epimerase